MHAVGLRDGLVGLVDEEQVVLREIVEQGRRGFAGQAAAEVARIIFYAVAVADRAHHFDVEHGALRDALGFDEFSLALQFFFPPIEFGVDGLDGALALFGGHDVVRLRVDRDARQVFLSGADFAGYRIDLADRVDLLAPHLDAIGVVFVRRDKSR